MRTSEVAGTLRSIVSQIRAARSLREAAILLRRSALAAGLTHVAVVMDASHPDAPTDEHGESLVELLGWPKPFIDEWLERNYSARSAAALRARLEHLPFAWSVSSAPEGAGLDAALLSQGITAGVMAPVRLPRGRFGLVSWLGPRDRAAVEALVEENGPEFLLLAHYYLELVRERRDPPPVVEDLARLSPRELECLTLLAKGASDAEAGAALGLTARTVRFHVGNGAEKLGARSRTHAVALATQLGILGPIF